MYQTNLHTNQNQTSYHYQRDTSILFVAAHWETQWSGNLIPFYGYYFYIIIFTIILICAIVNNKKKVASQYKNNGLPITITHIVIVEKVMVKCVIVEQL